MVSFAVIMSAEFGQGPRQRALAEQDQPRQALLLGRADPTFRKSVSDSGFWPEAEWLSRCPPPAPTETMRRTSCRDHAEHSGMDEDSPKPPGWALRGDLLHPLLIRMSGDTRHADAAAFQMNEKQHIVSHQAPPTQHLHGEEVSAGQDVHVSSDKVLPRSRLASLRSRSNAVASQNVPHRLVGQAVTQMPALRRCGHIPSQYSHAPFAPPKLPRPVERGGGLDTVGVWNHRTSGRRAFDTRPGWCQAWQCRRPLGALCVPHASRSSARVSALGITQPQSGWQLRPQNTVLRGHLPLRGGDTHGAVWRQTVKVDS